jgi:hypothetical protein
MDETYLNWSGAWLFAAAGAWTILCCLSTARLSSIIRFVGPSTLLVVSLAFLGWSSRSDTFDAFLVPVLVFCSSLVAAAGVVRTYKRMNRNRAQRGTAGFMIAVYTVAQATACALIMSILFMEWAATDGVEVSVGRLGDGYSYRQYSAGLAFTSTFLETTVYWVPPPLPFLELSVAASHVKVDPPPVARKNTGGRGNRRLVVMHRGSAVDQLVY